MLQGWGEHDISKHDNLTFLLHENQCIFILVKSIHTPYLNNTTITETPRDHKKMTVSCS